MKIFWHKLKKSHKDNLKIAIQDLEYLKKKIKVEHKFLFVI